MLYLLRWLAAHWRHRSTFTLRGLLRDCREFGTASTLRDFYNNLP